MPRLCGSILVALTILGGLLSSRTALAVSLPDTLWANFVIVTDTKTEFKAIGSWTIIDRTDPPDYILGRDHDVDGDFWYFNLKEGVTDWRVPPTAVDNGARGVYIEIYGDHKDGPHDPPGPPVDNDPNVLELEVVTANVNLLFGALAPNAITVTGRIAHPLVVGTKPHWDLYGWRHKAQALKGPPHMVTGPAEVHALHTGEESQRKIPFALVMGSSEGAGSRASYDAGTGRLTLHTGVLDILNSTGMLAPGIEASYVGDAVVDAQVADIVLQYLGPTGDGGYRFGGAPTTVTDPQGELAIDGVFSEYLIYDTSQLGVIDSYAVHDGMSIVVGGSDCASGFLDDFVDVNVMGERLSDSDRRSVQGLGLSFVTAGNFATMTGGFTVSLFDIPATIALCALRSEFPTTHVHPSDAHGSVDPGRSFPNPFHERTTLHYRVSQAGPVRIEIFDPSGRMVRRLVDERQVSGDHSVVWDGASSDGRRVNPGLYFYRLTQNGGVRSDGIVRLK